MYWQLIYVVCVLAAPVLIVALLEYGLHPVILAKLVTTGFSLVVALVKIVVKSV